MRKAIIFLVAAALSITMAVITMIYVYRVVQLIYPPNRPDVILWISEGFKR